MLGHYFITQLEINIQTIFIKETLRFLFYTLFMLKCKKKGVGLCYFQARFFYFYFCLLP